MYPTYFEFVAGNFSTYLHEYIVNARQLIGLHSFISWTHSVSVCMEGRNSIIRRTHFEQIVKLFGCLLRASSNVD